ncbi:hypothetical protein Taro_046314 [Colocasia esculenta]|uniref:Uncharacterized protein n=1 Tax=Colocasia esculenta TaxID=4460 RepID=A0A843WTG6_COLES|nr:hypothetical protein [Colocasia esculenta]
MCSCEELGIMPSVSVWFGYHTSDSYIHPLHTEAHTTQRKEYNTHEHDDSNTLEHDDSNTLEHDSSNTLKLDQVDTQFYALEQKGFLCVLIFVFITPSCQHCLGFLEGFGVT